jgi:AraC-like DNA-binding protein
VPLTRRHLALINDWEPHSYDHLARDANSLVLALYLERQWLDVQRLAVTPTRHFPLPGIEAPQPLLDVIDQLTSTLLLQPDGQADCDLLLSQMLRLIDETCALSAGTRRRPDAELSEAEVDRRLARCIEWMRENLAAREPIESVVSRFGLSRPHGFYLFQRHFGMGPAAYWNVLRMEHAIQKLHSRKGPPIGHIAADLGFESQGNFTRFFRGIQGVAPRDYQMAARPRRVA